MRERLWDVHLMMEGGWDIGVLLPGAVNIHQGEGL